MLTMPQPRFSWALLVLLGIVSGCAFEFSDVAPREQGEVGDEVFRLVCMNLAAQAYPNDLTGERFSPACDGKMAVDAPDEPLDAPTDEKEARAYARYQALIARRDQLVPALESAFNPEHYRKDELHDFLAKMVPLYDPPAEDLPVVTRAASKLLFDLIDPDAMLSNSTVKALERMSPRDGYRPARHTLGLSRAMFGYPRIDDVLRTVLDAVDVKDGPARAEFEEVLRASALDLATADQTKPDPKNPGTLTLALQLLFADADAFKGMQSTPSFVTVRDERGLAKPAMDTIEAPFVDKDGDGRADVNAQGHFVLATGAQEVTPYSTFAALGTDKTKRDANGRALNSQNQPLYQSFDVDRTMLAGTLREIKPLLDRTPEQKSAIEDLLYGSYPLMGDWKQRTYDFGKKKYAFNGPDTTTGVMFDLVHAVAAVLPLEQTEDLLYIVERLVRDHERELAGLVEAMLYIKERSDLYPEAEWEHPHDFWDEVLAWSIKLATPPGVMEGVLQSLTLPETAAFGQLLGNWMRFRDAASYPMGTRDKLIALGIDPNTVNGKLNEDCTGSACGRACSTTNPCPAPLACAVSGPNVDMGTCGSVSDAVKAHRINLNFPCPNPPDQLTSFFDSASDTKPGCVPAAPLPAKHHRGIRGCPEEKPEDGASCADAGGFGLCSWDAGSCTCDCAGGVCRHGAKPTWRCTADVVPGFDQWVDRNLPDERLGEDGRSNQSIFQRSAALTRDLHYPNKLCNKPGAKLDMTQPFGTNDPLIPSGIGGPLEAILAGILGSPLLGPYEECGLLEEPEIVQLYFRAITGTGKFPLKNQVLVGLLDLFAPLKQLGIDLSLDLIMERQSQIRGLWVNGPKPEAISRFAFGPYVYFQKELVDVVRSVDKLPMVDLHQDTIYAWEMKDPIGGMNLFQTLIPMLKALDPQNGGAKGSMPLFGDLLSIIHRYWSSRQTMATTRACDDATMPPTCNETAPLFSFQANGVSWEELVAEAFVDAKLFSRLQEISVAIDSIELPGGRKSVPVLAEALRSLLLPDRSCADGDCTNKRLTYRNGESLAQTNTGKEVGPVSPIYMLLDSLNAIDKRFEEATYKDRLKPWRGARSRLVDVLFDVDRSGPDAWRFKNSRSRDVVLAALTFLRGRMTEYKQQEADCLAGGAPATECNQLRDWAFGLTGRLEKSLGQPVSAASIRLLEKLRTLEGDPGGKFMDLLKYLSTETAGDDTFAGSLVGMADLAQVLQDTENTGPLMTFVARAISDNANDVAAGTAPDLDINNGTVQKTLTLFQKLQDIVPETATEKSSLAALFSRLTTRYGANGETPLDVIVDTIVAVNRAAPMPAGDAALTSDDVRTLYRETADFLSSDRHGLERLYDVVQSREY